MNKIIKKYYYVIFLGVFAYLCIGVYKNWFVNIDLAVYKFSQLFYSGITTNILKGITFLGSAVWLILLILVLLVLIKDKVNQLYLIAMMVLEEGMNLVLKYIIRRPRPPFVHLVVEDSFSFPSGHAMGSTAFYGVCIYLIWQTKLSKKRKILLTLLLSLLIILIGFSRIYLGVHYFSDIMAGIFFSLFLLCWLNDIAKRRQL